MNARNPDGGDRRTNEIWSTGRAMAYGYDNAHQLTSVDAPRPSDVAHYRYDAAGNPVDRAELGFPVTNSFNNLNQIVSGVWTGTTLTVAGAVNYPTGSVAVNGIGGTIYPDGSFAVTNVPVSLGTNVLTAVYNGPAYTNAPMTATDTVSVVLANSSYTHDANRNLTSDATFIYQYDSQPVDQRHPQGGQRTGSVLPLRRPRPPRRGHPFRRHRRRGPPCRRVRTGREGGGQ